MMDALTIYGFVAGLRHAGYLSFAAAVLGLAEAHYAGLRKVAGRLKAALLVAGGAATSRFWLRRGPRGPSKASPANSLAAAAKRGAKFSTCCRIRA